MILTEIGEVGVHVGDRTIVLRPSLYAMSLLGGPREVVAVFAGVMADNATGAGDDALQRRDALAVLGACAADADLEVIQDIFGCWGEGGEYEPGREPWPVALTLARCLLKHGIVGALPALPRRSGEEVTYSQEFDCREHVALAMAHLGLAERDAWQMTMTGLVGALRAKFPPEKGPGAGAPTVEEHSAAMEWFEQIEAARAKRQGPH